LPTGKPTSRCSSPTKTRTRMQIGSGVSQVVGNASHISALSQGPIAKLRVVAAANVVVIAGLELRISIASALRDRTRIPILVVNAPSRGTAVSVAPRSDGSATAPRTTVSVAGFGAGALPTIRAAAEHGTACCPTDGSRPADSLLHAARLAIVAQPTSLSHVCERVASRTTPEPQ